MMKSTRKLVVVGAILVAALLVTASASEACWGWGCYQPVSYYTPYCGSWCAPCGYTSCYYGCGWPARRALCGSYRWYYTAGCCYDTCSTCCCDPCSCDTVVGSSCCGATTTNMNPTPAQQPTPAPAENTMPAPSVAPEMPSNPVPANPVPPVSSNSSAGVPSRANSGLLTVWVPANAKVYINGNETTTQGTRRRYVSNGLQSGLTYKYEVRAEVVRNGMVAEEQKTVYLTAGAAEGVAFGFNREPSNQVAAAQQ
ncbi:MAG TPA: cyclic lactone autoinducer peptide [Thermoguttaceae bacterium]|nr:cyclic lactone autoinducer peptide [Thermoguttaceae bacterium]